MSNEYTKCNITLPANLVERIDGHVGDRGRSNFLARAAERLLAVECQATTRVTTSAEIIAWLRGQADGRYEIAPAVTGNYEFQLAPVVAEVKGGAVVAVYSDVWASDEVGSFCYRPVRYTAKGLKRLERSVDGQPGCPLNLYDVEAYDPEIDLVSALGWKL